MATLMDELQQPPQNWEEHLRKIASYVAVAGTALFAGAAFLVF
jgi:hypothetical protein